MITDDSAGVVLFRERPAKSDADASVAYMRPIQKKHAALTIPSVRRRQGQAQELSIWTFKGASLNDKPTGMTRSVMVPSIFKHGMHSLSFTRVEKETVEARASFDVSSLLSLQHVFDMHCDVEITQNESDEDRLIVTAVYILAIRTAVDYYEKAASSMPEMHARMATVMNEHDKALRAAGIDVQVIDQFIRGCGVMASTICMTAFKVNSQYMADARRQLAMSGLAAILRTHMRRDEDIYLGVDIVDDSKRELLMLSAYTRFAGAIDNSLERDAMSMSIQECLIGKQDTISNTLRMRAIELYPDTTCRVCQNRISHFAVSVGRCHLCPHKLDITCEKCIGDSCSVCDEHATLVDFERTAIESVTRSCIIMRENNKLRSLVEGGKAKDAKSHATEKKVGELKKEIDRLTMENSDLRTQAKRERRADKRGSRDTRVCDLEDAKLRLQVENASLISSLSNLEATLADREVAYAAVEESRDAEMRCCTETHKEEPGATSTLRQTATVAEQTELDSSPAQYDNLFLRYNQLLGEIKAKDAALDKLLARISAVSTAHDD